MNLLLLFNSTAQILNNIEISSDNRKARKYFESAAAQGHGEAQYNLGLYWEQGLGGGQDYKKAFDFFSQAAAQGAAEAQCAVGQCLERENNLKQAVKYYELAAAQGHAMAQLNAGVCF